MVCLKLSASFKRQLLSALFIDTIALSHGISIGWLSPVLPRLQSDDSPLSSGALTVEQTSWIGSFYCIGALIGTYVYITVQHKYGSKFTLNLIAFPQIGFWFLVMFGDSYTHLMIARLLSGITGGGVFSCIPLFIADISEPKIRGQIGAIQVVYYNVGVLLAYIIGTLFSYETFPYITLALPVMYAVGIPFLPECPQSLIKHNKVKEAENAYKFYRGVSRDSALSKEYAEEFELMKIKEEMAKNETNVGLSDFTSKAAIKGLVISVSMITINMCSGGFAIINYAAAIYRDSGSDISPNISSIITGIVQICGCLTLTLLIDKTGRKILLIISTVGMTFGYVILGVFSYLSHNGYDVASYSFVAIVSLSFTVYIGCIGIFTIPFFLMAEVLPSKIRSHGCIIAYTFYLLSGVVILKYLPIMVATIQLHGTVWVFALICAVSTAFTCLFVPETKGKNLTTET